MARSDKVAAVTLVRERMQASSATVLTEYRGLTVAELARLRAELRQTDAEYKVVKNTLTRIAVRDAGFEVPDDLLTGPTAVTFCAGDPVAVAKVLRRFSRENPELVIKGSILDGRLLDAEDTLRLADLASREELLARVAGLLESVVAQPARLALAALSRAARLFAALQDKRVARGETIEAAAAEGAPPAPSAPAGEADAPTPRAAGDQTPEPAVSAAGDAAAGGPEAVADGPVEVGIEPAVDDEPAPAPAQAPGELAPPAEAPAADSLTTRVAAPVDVAVVEAAADAPLTVDPAFAAADIPETETPEAAAEAALALAASALRPGADEVDAAEALETLDAAEAGLADAPPDVEPAASDEPPAA